MKRYRFKPHVVWVTQNPVYLRRLLRLLGYNVK